MGLFAKICFGAISILNLKKFGNRSGSCVVVLPSFWPTARFSKNDWNDPRKEANHPCMDSVLGGQVRLITHLVKVVVMMEMKMKMVVTGEAYYL